MKAPIVAPKRIIVSRVDSIGDVVLTLPLCTFLKEKFPETEIIFLAAQYTLPVVACCKSVDRMVNWSEFSKLPTAERTERFRELKADVIIHVFPNKEVAALAKKAKIEHRIGTSHRSFHLLTCNHRVAFTRKKSEHHESQLNFHLLRPFEVLTIPSFEEINTWTKSFVRNPAFDGILRDKKTGKSILLHPKSQGSAVEWPTQKFAALAEELVAKGYQVFVTGTEAEGLKVRDHFVWSENLVDTTGQMSLEQLIAFISEADALVACSTGPLHLAGIQNIACIGLFSPKRPIHPGRWRPLGLNSRVLTARDKCPHTKKENCTCLEEISVDIVLSELEQIVPI